MIEIIENENTTKQQIKNENITEQNYLGILENIKSEINSLISYFDTVKYILK